MTTGECCPFCKDIYSLVVHFKHSFNNYTFFLLLPWVLPHYAFFKIVMPISCFCPECHPPLPYPKRKVLLLSQVWQQLCRECECGGGGGLTQEANVKNKKVNCKLKFWCLWIYIELSWGKEEEGYENCLGEKVRNNLGREIKKGNTLIFEIKYKKRKQTVWEDKERYYLRVCEREKKRNNNFPNK